MTRGASLAVWGAEQHSPTHYFPKILAVHYERHVPYIQVITSEGVILQELSRLVGVGGEGVIYG